MTSNSVWWIDSHCHLQEQYRPQDANTTQLVSEALAAGVNGVVCVGTDAKTSLEGFSLVEGLSVAASQGDGFGAWCTVGLHPHEASAGIQGVVEVLDQVLEEGSDRVVAIGECGLDYHYDHSPRAAQRAAFASQVALARERNLALVVHSREAWDDTIDILRAERAPDHTIVHCFTGGPDDARRCLDLGAYLSFSGIITFKNASDVREALCITPLDRMLVETDAPFLAPVPHRGEQNRPAWVSIVGDEVARIRSVPAEELARQTTATTRLVFCLD
jgi:TatD DNase family protein